MAVALLAMVLFAGCGGRRFDLQCHLHETDFDQGEAGFSKDYVVEERIDLDRKKWCTDDCATWADLRFDGRTLTTWDTVFETRGENHRIVHEKIVQTIDLKTGKLSSAVYIRARPGDFDEIDDRVIGQVGDCAKAPFQPAERPRL